MQEASPEGRGVPEVQQWRERHGRGAAEREDWWQLLTAKPVTSPDSARRRTTRDRDGAGAAPRCRLGSGAGEREENGRTHWWVGKDTHGTPMPIKVGRPWVARTVGPAQSHTECATHTQNRYTANMAAEQVVEVLR